MPANNLSDNLTNLSKTEGYKNFLGMPLIGSVVSRKKKEQEEKKENKDFVSIPKKLLSKLLNPPEQESQIEPLQVFDKSSDVLTNIYNVMRMDHKMFMANMIADKKFDAKLEKIKESRTKELIDLFAGKRIEREKKKQVKKEIEDLQKKLKELEDKSKKPTGAPPAPAPTSTTVTSKKTGEVTKTEIKSTTPTPTTPSPAVSVTPKPPSAPAPTAQPPVAVTPKPSPTPAADSM